MVMQQYNAAVISELQHFTNVSHRCALLGQPLIHNRLAVQAYQQWLPGDYCSKEGWLAVWSAPAVKQSRLQKKVQTSSFWRYVLRNPFVALAGVCIILQKLRCSTDCCHTFHNETVTGIYASPSYQALVCVTQVNSLQTGLF